MRSVSIIFHKEGIQTISDKARDTETLFIKKDPQLLCSNHRKTVGLHCCQLPIYHTPTGLYSFAKSFIFHSSTNKIKISKTDSRVRR